MSHPPPVLGLIRYGREWVPSIVFTSSRDRAEFLRLADRLCREFAAEIVEKYGGEGPDHKEYWTLRVGSSEWVLMRSYYPHGIALDGKSPADLAAFERIAAKVGAVPNGWRYRWVRFRRSLLGRRESPTD